MNYLANFYEQRSIFKSYIPTPNHMIAKAHSLFAEALKWRPVFIVSYAVELMCLSAAKLIVLDRLSDFAGLHAHSKMLKRLARIVLTVVCLGNAAGLAASSAAALRLKDCAETVSASSMLYAANNSHEGSTMYKSAAKAINQAFEIESVQSFCEVVMLLLIVASFVIAGVFCLRRVSASLLAIDRFSVAAETGSALRRQILGTTSVVFVSFLLRSVQSTMLAVALYQSDFDKTCKGVASRCDSTCYNLHTHMYIWMDSTPEFQLTIVLISSPLTLLVTLWGMTTKRAVQIMCCRQDPEQTSLKLQSVLAASMQKRRSTKELQSVRY
jgi:hypothetical protein